MIIKSQALHLNQQKVVPQNPKGFYESRKLIFTIDLQPFKMLLPSHTLSKFSLH